MKGMTRRATFICLVGTLLVLIFPAAASATGGGLRKNSIKTCPNGITYGEHSDGHGGTHWHVAVTNGKNYYASGGEIANDPCPNSNKDKGTAGPTSGTAPATGGQNTNPIPNADATIRRVVVDNKDIDIEDAMVATVSKKNVDITIYTTNSKATASFENRALEMGDNEFTILVTAENGNRKEYKLNIIRETAEGTASILKFEFSATEIEFVNNEGSVSVLSTQGGADYSYELSDKDAVLKIYRGEEPVDSFKDFDDVTDYKLVVIDKDGNEKNYYLHVNKLSPGATAAALATTGAVMLGVPAAGVAIGVKAKKKKK